MKNAFKMALVALTVTVLASCGGKGSATADTLKTTTVKTDSVTVDTATKDTTTKTTIKKDTVKK